MVLSVCQLCSVRRYILPPVCLASDYWHTPNEGLNLTNMKRRKLEVFVRKFMKAALYFIWILINMIENETIMSKSCLLQHYRLTKYLNYDS